MLKNPLLENIKSGKTSLGAYVHSPDMVELAAHIGLDFFTIDHMFTGLDWGKTEELIRTGEAAGITPSVRLQSEPWLGYDHRLCVDLARCNGIGAQFVLVSHSCKKEIEECMKAATWHRKCQYFHSFNSLDEWETKAKKIEEEVFVIPHLESNSGLAELDETLSLPGLKGFYFAMTDLSKQMRNAVRPDFYYPKLWEHVKKTVEIGKKKGITIWANTSYAYSMEEMKKRIKTLHDAGVKVIHLQNLNFLVQIGIGGFLKDVKSELGI